MVTGVSAGTATITATLEDGTYATCEVTVYAKSVTLTPTVTTVYKGETVTIDANTIPDGESLVWTSSNTGVATVTEGNVTTLGVGQTIIRAAINNEVYAECTVNVVEFALTQTSVDVDETQTVTLSVATLLSGYTVTWSTANEAVATVDSTGKVTGVKAGMTTITATVTDGASASCTVYVTIADGVYSIGKASGLFVGVGSTPALGSNVTICAPTTASLAQAQQNWIIRHVSGELYTVELSSTPNLWLSCNGNSVTLGETAQCWRISYENGGYRLLNEGSYNRALTVEQPGAYPGLKVLSGSYSNSSSFCWYLEKKPTIYIEFFMDYGLIEKHREGRTDEATYDLLQSIILEKYLLVVNAYAEQAGLNIVCRQNAVTLLMSDADRCPKSGVDTPCECVTNCQLQWNQDPHQNNAAYGFSCDSHCESIVRLRNNLIVGIPRNTIRFLNTGHNACYSNGVSCNTTSAGALSCYTDPIICSKNPYYNADTMAHEIAHLFGLGHHEAIEGSPCLMQYGERTWFDEDLETWWCDDCIEVIRENRYKFWTA